MNKVTGFLTNKWIVSAVVAMAIIAMVRKFAGR